MSSERGRQHRRAMREGARSRDVERELPPGTVPYFRERLYATFTGLAIVRVVESGTHLEARHAFLALLMGVIGIVVAGTLSEYIAHLIVHRTVARGSELRIMIRAGLGALWTVAAPIALIGAAWLGWMELHLALRISSWIYIVTLAGIGWLAVRRSTLPVLAKIIVLAGLVAAGFGVVALQQLAKSV
ncbi:hypothetical protein [Microbacterium nymphoidis]|uniref:hypothetical protein n=1 Tax=Microbacterium nymphoidis TaxID=2898586 RepID=UPI001E5D956A|nr:hypothetical protein [Microbacterium nymphoidis]MCD2499591.1 hypothetical protein [Microbacterium nymphoidis]